MRYLLLGLAVVLLLGCARPKTRISEQQAIALAVQIATTDSFHFTGTAERPTNIKAQLETFGNAAAQMQAANYSFGYDSQANSPAKNVWVVTLDGSWPRNFPALLATEPTREPWGHLAVVLDAQTGALITMGAR